MNEIVIFGCSDCKHKLPITKLVDMDFKFCPYCGKPYREENMMKLSLNLLTIDEAKKLPEEILKCKAPKNFTGWESRDGYCNWWLCSPGNSDRDAACVEGVNGYVYVKGNFVRVMLGVRPALRLESDISNLAKDEDGYVLYGKMDGVDIRWIDISEYLGESVLLMKECFSQAKRFDKAWSVYEISEIKQYLASLMEILFT